MTDINDLKFTIEPEETIEIEQFVNNDYKEKKKKNLDTSKLGILSKKRIYYGSND